MGLTDFSANPAPSHYSPHAIRELLKQLALMHNLPSICALLCATRGRLPKLLLAMNGQLSRARRPSEKLRLVHFLRFLCELLDDAAFWLTRQNIQRDVLYTLLRTLADTKLVRDDVCQLLLQLCEKWVSPATAADVPSVVELAKHLPAITSALIPLADTGTAAATAVLHYLIGQCRVPLRAAITLLEPFPSSAAFASLNDICKSIRGAVPLVEELSRFVERNSAATVRLASLRHLRERVEASATELSSRLLGGSKEEELRAVVGRVIWLAASAASQQHAHTDDVRVEIAALLGLLSPFDPVLLHAARPAASDSLEADADSLFAAKQRALCKLTEYLIDSNVETVQAAYHCLEDVLLTASGHAAREHLDEQQQTYLKPFRLPSKEPKRTVCKSRMVALCLFPSDRCHIGTAATR